VSGPPAFAAADARGRLHLVLDGARAELTVSLDGAALRIARPDAADALAPVRRIDRVTCRGAVLWATPALAALADAGAAVGFFAEGGRLAAALVGAARAGGGSFAAALARVEGRADLDARLEDWRRAQISMLARRAGEADPAGAARAGWTAAEAAVAVVVALPRPAARRLAREARGFATLMARRALHEAGCPPEYVGASAPAGRDLSGVIGQIALWRLALLLRGPARERLRAAAAADRAAGRCAAGPAAAAAAELARPRLRRDLAADLGRLRDFLADLAAGPPPASRGARRWAG
jgi:hypothetical protein